MVDVTPGRDQLEDLKKRNRLRRLKFKPQIAKTKRSAKRIRKEVQNLALKLYKTATFRRIALLSELHQKLLLHPLHKIR